MTRKAPLRLCRKVGCPELVKSGYCAAHQPKRKSSTQALRDLDKRKDPERTAFYQQRKWTQTSKRHRKQNPTCVRCHKAGRVVRGELVHHNPPLEALLANGLNPHDSQYLETLCGRCHLEELRNKRPAGPTVL